LSLTPDQIRSFMDSAAEMGAPGFLAITDANGTALLVGTGSYGGDLLQFAAENGWRVWAVDRLMTCEAHPNLRRE
jgi:hypothetical protein